MDPFLPSPVFATSPVQPSRPAVQDHHSNQVLDGRGIHKVLNIMETHEVTDDRKVHNRRLAHEILNLKEVHHASAVHQVFSPADQEESVPDRHDSSLDDEDTTQAH